jgi:hypothetical protein
MNMSGIRHKSAIDLRQARSQIPAARPGPAPTRSKFMKSLMHSMLAITFALLPALAAPHEVSLFATGLTGPTKVEVTRRGNVLVTERGTASNDGKLTRIDRSGAALTLLAGLPSGIEVTGQPSGPQAPVVDNCCVLHLTIGEGDMLRRSPAGPPAQEPNTTGSVSPIFSSVLRLVFSRPIDGLTAGFDLSRADHDTLADGRTVELSNAAGDKLWVRLVVDFKDARPDARTNVRGSNPFHMIASQHSDGLLVVDSGQNALLEVGIGWPRVVTRFPPVAQAPGIVPPFSDAVPTAVRHFSGNRYLVSQLTGVPFTAGVASIRLVNAVTGRDTPFISGLTSVTDILKIGPSIYVLEISSDLSTGAPGRLLYFRNRHAQPVEVASGLIGASGMAYDAKRDAIFIAEMFAGRITRVDR